MGKGCSEKSAETLEYIVKVLNGEETVQEARVKTTSVGVSLDESGNYVFMITADNGAALSQTSIQHISVCVQKPPADFEIIYPFKDNQILTTAPEIIYTDTPFNSDCHSEENSYTLYAKDSVSDTFEAIENTSIGEDGTTTNYFDEGKEKELTYCVYVEKSNGDPDHTVRTKETCFKFCNADIEDAGSSITIDIEGNPSSASTREHVSSSEKRTSEAKDTISTQKTVKFRINKNVKVTEPNACAISPHVSFAAISSETRIELNYITENTFTVDFSVPGTYDLVASLLVDTIKLADWRKSVTVCVYKRPEMSAAITPAEGALLPPGTITFRFSEITDWGDDCDWKLLENRGSKEYVVHLTSPTGTVQAIGLTDASGEITLTEEGEYEYYIETAFKNDEHALSTATKKYTFTVCKDEKPSIKEISIADRADGIELATNVSISMRSWGKDCGEVHQAPYFVVALYRFNGAKDFADTESTVPRQIYSVKSSESSIMLPTLSPSTVHRLTVLAYTNSGNYFAFKSADFRTRALWCTPDPCKNGICDELMKRCICPTDYSGKYCEKSVSSALLAVAIAVPLVVVIIVILVALYLIYKKTSVFGLKMPDFAKYMFSMPKLLDGAETSSKKIEDLVYKDPFNYFDWAKALLQSTEIAGLDNVCKALMYAYERNGKALSLLQSLIEWEVEQCTQEKTLFRSNSAATKCFSVYARMVGLPYLYRVLSPLLNKLLKDLQRQESGVEVRGDAKHTQGMTTELSTAYELDPSRMEEGDADFATTNLLAVQFACQMFLSSLMKTVDHCPAEFHVIANTIETAVLKKFPEYRVEHALSAFLFLRYFVAGISVPESFGLVDFTPSTQLRRQLILISKVVSNLSTTVKFSETEEFMIPLNEFLEEHENIIAEYYAKASEKRHNDHKLVDVPEKFYQRSIEVLAAQNGKLLIKE